MPILIKGMCKNGTLPHPFYSLHGKEATKVKLNPDMIS